jgi:hypothetical protein
MPKSSIFWGVGLAVALALTFGAGSASADSISYVLNTANSSLSGFPSPYAEVTVNLTSSTTADFTFTALNSYVFGDGGSVAANINASSFTVSNVAGNAPGGNGIYTVTGGGNEDGFGSFNLQIDSGNFSPSNRSTTITFTVTNNSGTWASASAVTTGNNGSPSQILAAHIGVGAGASPTGFASGAVAVPEPSSMAIAGLGAIGFVGFGLRRRLKK